MIKSAKRCLRKAIGRSCLTYDELLTLVTEVEAVLNSRPLTYVSSEDTEEPLTPSHLLVGYRILSLPDPLVPDDADYSSETLTHRRRHLLKTLGNFWRRWKKEFLLELREFHRTRVQMGTTYNLKKGEIVTIYDEGHPRGLWRLGRIEDMIQSADGGTRGVIVGVTSKRGHVKFLEIQCSSPPEVDDVPPTHDDVPDAVEEHGECDANTVRPVRRAAAQARDRIVGCLIED